MIIRDQQAVTDFELDAAELTLTPEAVDAFPQRIQTAITAADTAMRANRTTALQLCSIKQQVARRFEQHLRSQA